MYESHFGFTASPFKLNPDPKFFFGSRSHNKAMAYLHYGLKQAEGFIVVTGPVGSGKTMVIGQLLDQLNVSNVVAAQLITSNIDPDELLSQILSAFRIEPESQGRTGELEAFEDYLFDQLNRGKRVLLIVDEAQNLPFKTLEELRMLSNIDYDGTPLFQVFLVGQPEFRETMQSAELEQLRQRVIASYHLESLEAEELREYILHRLSIAGWRGRPNFEDDAFEEILMATNGLPRRINTLTNRLLLYCALEKKDTINAEIVTIVKNELEAEKLAARGEDGALETPQLSDKRTKKTQPEPVERSGLSDDDVEDALTNMRKLASGASVFDRLRAKRDSDETQDPQAALAEIASAINNATQAAQPVIADKDVSEEKQSVNKQPVSNDILTTLKSARDDLKRAQASLKETRNSFDIAAERRKQKRAALQERLVQAEEILNEVKTNWR